VKRYITVLLAAALCACGKTGEKEPNDDFPNATPVKAGRVEATLSSAKDVDFYRLDSAEDTTVLAAHLNGIRDADFVVSVYDQDRRELKRFDETTVGGDEDVSDVGLRRGAAYIGVSNKNAQFANPAQPYTLELKVLRGPGREREPDDSPQTASKLELPGVTRGHYYPSRNLLSGDTDYAELDWFKVDIAQQGLFLLNIDVGEVSKVDAIFEIYDTNGYRIKEVDSGGVGQGESLKNFGVRGPAQYALKLWAKNGAANAEVPYEILTELIPYQGKTEFEPNDQRVDATPFAQDSITGAIAPEGDQDWYKVVVGEDAKQLLRASATGVEGLDLSLRLADSLGNVLLAVDNMGKGQPETLTGYGVTKGEYYLILSEKTGRKADGRQTYTLAKSLVAWQPGLEFELNDSTAAVQQLKVGEAVDGYFGWKGDADHYQFNVYNKGTIVFELAGVLNVQAAATLFDQDVKELQTWSASKPGDSLLFERELDAGTYTLRLKAAKEDQNNVRDKYSLRIKVR
jgi:hypothetical protein